MVLGACQTTNQSYHSLVYPPGAPKIDSHYKSMIGVHGQKRRNIHQGIDIIGKNGLEIISVADGTVLDATVDKCWGPTVVIDHGIGIDGKKIIALYGHVDEMLVTENEEVKRGQVIARLGNNFNKFRCIAGVRHLHFQIGRIHRNKYFRGTYWGHLRFLNDGRNGVNPHLLWADGPNNITCFDPERDYETGTITYPVLCGEVPH